MVIHMLTGGGHIRCRRCTAKSSRTGLQCGRPALKTSATQKCQFHGARGSGPKTEKGKARIASAHLVHGRETTAMRAVRSRVSALLSQLEDGMHLLGITNSPRSRGRKANGYVPLRSLDDIRRMISEGVLRQPEGSVEGEEKICAKPVVRED